MFARLFALMLIAGVSACSSLQPNNAQNSYFESHTDPEFSVSFQEPMSLVGSPTSAGAASALTRVSDLKTSDERFVYRSPGLFERESGEHFVVISVRRPFRMKTYWKTDFPNDLWHLPQRVNERDGITVKQSAYAQLFDRSELLELGLLDGARDIDKLCVMASAYRPVNSPRPRKLVTVTYYETHTCEHIVRFYTDDGLSQKGRTALNSFSDRAGEALRFSASMIFE